MVKALFISKYATFSETSKPGRQYFLSSELAKSGWDVMLVGSRSVPDKIENFLGVKKCINNKHLRLVVINGPRVDFGFNFKRIVSWGVFEVGLILSTFHFRRFRPDVIFVSSLSILTFLYGVLYKKIFRIPLIIEVRDIYPKTLVEFGKFSPASLVVRLLSWIEQVGYKNADLLVSPLENFYRHAEQVLGKSVSFKWVPMGYDSYLTNESLSERSEHLRREIVTLKERGRFVVAYAGSHGYGDRLEMILNVAKSLVGSAIHFVFIGSGPAKRELIDAYGQLSNVSFFDPIPKQDVVGVLSECSLLINLWHNTSLYEYGVSPNKWIDYALSKRPFLTNLRFDLKVVKNMPNCLVSSDDSEMGLRDDILRVLEMPAGHLDELGRKGYEFVVNNLGYSKLAGGLKGDVEALIIRAKR